MHLLANENVPACLVSELRSRGHDVAWIRQDSPGAADDEVIARAVAEGRVLVTFDKDFGELAFRHGLPATCGVVLLRLAAPSAETLALAAAGALESRTDWAGHFSVVEHTRVRMRSL